MDGNKAISANFATYPVNVTISPSGAGTVSKTPNQPTYPPGTVVQLAASSSYPFLGWSGDASGTDNPISLTVDGTKNITASFLAYALTTTVSPTGGGTIARDPNQTLYGPGPVTLTLTTASGYDFVRWEGDASGSDNPLTIQMDSDKTVHAITWPSPPACGNWTDILTEAYPAPRGLACAVWDPPRHRMILFGGGDYSSHFNDLWQFTVSGTPAWTQLAPAGTPPSPRSGAKLVYDSSRDRLLLFGGTSNAGYQNDVWALSLAGTPTWTQVTTSGTPAPPRTSHAMIYDPVRDRLVIFGGIQSGPWNDLWTLSLSGTPTWQTFPHPPGMPPEMRGQSGVYDAARDRMIVLGSLETRDVWLLDLGAMTWKKLWPWGPPHPASGWPAVGYDPVRDRIILVGGYPDVAQVTALSLKHQPVWVPLSPGGVAFQGRGYPAGVYDPDDDLMFVFGGVNGSTRLNDNKRLDFSGGHTLDYGINDGSVQLTPNKCCYAPGEQVSLVPNPSPTHSFLNWIGDASGNANPLNLTMNSSQAVLALSDGPVVAVEDPPVAFALAARPNPSSGSTRIEFALPRETRVRLAVYDVTGREVARLVDGVQSAGRHAVSWGSRETRGGLYFVRFETSDGTRNKRIAVLR
jgi:hypothetical protein